MNKQSNIAKDDNLNQKNPKQNQQQPEKFPPEIDKLKASPLPTALPEVACTNTALGDSTQGKKNATILM